MCPDIELQNAIELLKSRGMEVSRPGEAAIEPIPANSPHVEMQRALASASPGGDLAMASQAGLALKCGELESRVVLLENSLQRLAKVLLGDEASERPAFVESEPEPVGPAGEDTIGQKLEDTGLPVADESRPVEEPPPCICGHDRMQHHVDGHCLVTPCGCSDYVSPGHDRVERGDDDLPREV